MRQMWVEALQEYTADGETRRVGEQFPIGAVAAMRLARLRRVKFIKTPTAATKPAPHVPAVKAAPVREVAAAEVVADPLTEVASTPQPTTVQPKAPDESPERRRYRRRDVAAEDS